MNQLARRRLVATLLACLSCACGEAASPFVGFEGARTANEPWSFPTIGASSPTLAAGSGQPPERDAQGAWFAFQVEQATDMLHDPQRELVYISTRKGEVLRYDLKEHVVTPGWNLGGSLFGMDLSPDGNTLLVADPTPAVSCLHVIDLNTEQERQIVLTLPDAQRARPLSLAFLDADSVLIAQEAAGVSDLLLLTLSDENVRPVHKIAARTLLSHAADRSIIAFVSNEMGFGRYRVADDVFEDATAEGKVSQVVVSPHGDQYAVAGQGSVVLYDAAFARVRSILGTGALNGVAYAADGEQLVVGWTDAIAVHELEKGRRIAALDGYGRNWTKATSLKASDDGRWLFAMFGSRLVIYVLAL